MALRNLLSACTIAILLFTLAVPVVQAQESPLSVRNLALGLSYTLSQNPASSYVDTNFELTDGKFGGTYFRNAEWQGHNKGSTRSVTFDLGSNKSISKIDANFLSNTAGIFFPVTVSMYVSMDGVSWGTLKHINSKYPAQVEKEPPETQMYVWDGTADHVPGNQNAVMAYARYVKLTFRNSTDWVFLDEIEIWGTDGKTATVAEVQPDAPAYLAPGQATAGIHNMVQLDNGWNSNGPEAWTRSKLESYVGYVNQRGVPQAWFYDGVLFSAVKSPAGRNYGTSASPSNMDDWQKYLDKTFIDGGDLSELNEATKEVGTKLGQPDHKLQVMLMIPYPAKTQTNFGDVDGDGVSENFGAESADLNKQKAMKWYVDSVTARWNASNYSHLELAGFNWSSDDAYGDENIIPYTSGLVHGHQLVFHWIPNFYASKSFAWKQLGFDAASLQPDRYAADTDATRIQDASQLAKQYGLGLNIETDERMNTTGGQYLQQYMDYLNGGVTYGYMTEAYKTYDQGTESLYSAAISQDPAIRGNYDRTYQFVKGVYEKPNVTLDRDTLNIETGDTAALVATVHPDNAVNKKVTWSSDNIKVAAVDEEGSVTALSPGTAHITVAMADGGNTAVSTVTVSQGPLQNLALGRSYTVTSPVIDSGSQLDESRNSPDDGTKLTDGVIGTRKWTKKAEWVGYIWQDKRNIVIDLGEKRSLRKMSAWILQDNSQGVWFPKEVTFYASNTPNEWAEVGKDASKYPVSQSGSMVQNYTVNDLNVAARYVRISFDVDAWVYISDLQVWGLPEVQAGDQEPATTPDVLPSGEHPLAGSKEAGGKKAEVLIPNGYYPDPSIGKWSTDDFIPYVAYLDKDHQMKDTLFDSFMFSSYGAAPSGNNYGGTATKEDWKYYVDQLFQTDKQMGALNQAVGRVKKTLGLHGNYKVKVNISIPFPGQINNWGDGLNFNYKEVGEDQALANRIAAVKWYVGYTLSKWKDAQFENLDLVSFYWLNEWVPYPDSPIEEHVVQGAGRIVHEAGPYTFDWIPWNQAAGYKHWKRLGFDNALLQPNYAFSSLAQEGGGRLQFTAELSKMYGLGVEMENHWDILLPGQPGQWARDNYVAYLDAAYEYGYQDSFLAWYQNTNDMLIMEKSSYPEVRHMYDLTYQFIKGTYRDSTTPVTTDDAPNGWVNQDVTVHLNAVDSQSGVAATYYTVDGGPPQTGTAVTLTDEGAHTISYWSVDNAGNSEAPHTATVKIDKTAPKLTVQLDKSVLWPPNHEMITVHASLDSHDAISGVESVVLTSITSNEPDRDAEDIRAEFGKMADLFDLRAERSGDGTGRVYTITYTVTDMAGNQSTVESTVTVPHNQ